MKIISRIIVAVFLALDSPPVAAGEVVPSPEALHAFREFTSFLYKEFTRIAQSGTLLGPRDTTLPEAKKRCDSLVTAAKDRKEIADAARLTFEAYSYVVRNWTVPKARRKVPEDKTLADLIARNPSGMTEGQMMMGYQIALIRLTKYFGKPSLTEEEVRMRDDVDFDSIGIPKASPAGDAGEKALSAEFTVAVAADGGLKLKDKAISKEALVAALRTLKSEAEDGGKVVLLTISADERSEYERVVEVLDAASQAGVTNVTFQAFVKSTADGKAQDAPQPPK